MMNKKSMAVAMAAVTVAMPMTQSFAATAENDQTQAIKDMKAKALDLMNKEYTKSANLLKNPALAGEKIFQVSMDVNGTKKGPYTSYSEFARAFDNAYNDLKEGQTIRVDYTYAKNVGYSTLADGTIVDYDTEKYTQTILDDLAGVNKTGDDKHDASDKELVNLPVGGVQYKVDEYSKDKTYQVKLTDGKDGIKRFLNVKVGDVKLDLTKPVLRQDANKDYYVDLDGEAITSVKDNDAVKLEAGVVNLYRDNATTNPIALSKAVIDGFYGDTNTADAADAKEIASDVIKQGITTSELNASELFNSAEGRTTTKGNELLNRVQELGYNLHEEGYSVKVTEPVASQELKVTISKQGDSDKTPRKIEEIKIVRDAADKKGESFTAIKELLNGNNKDKIVTAAGADRYSTAAEVSRKAFPTAADLKGDKAIVLVTGEQDKLVDGLTATPLAAALNGGDGAPVLLTGNTKLAQPVIDEMNRLKAEEVYIVGGAISKEIENELEKVYGMEVTRVSGDDRYDTSIEVANEIHDKTGAAFNTVFVAGGKSEADALSAGAPAAMKKAPILLTNEDKLNKDVKHFLDSAKVNNAAGSNVYVVGGTISKSAVNDIVDAADKVDVKRLSGDSRQDTNSEVIKEFFGTTADVEQVVVAKSDNKGMVDALGAGLYAGKNSVPVVLATKDITKDQEDVLNKINFKFDATDANHKVDKLQVGEGIASAVAKFIKNL